MLVRFWRLEPLEPQAVALSPRAPPGSPWEVSTLTRFGVDGNLAVSDFTPPSQPLDHYPEVAVSTPATAVSHAAAIRSSSASLRRPNIGSEISTAAQPI